MPDSGPPSTSDIDIRTASSPLWDQPLGELQRALDDPEDPSHEIAANIVRLTFEPLRAGLANQTSLLRKQLMDAIKPLSIDVGTLFPQDDHLSVHAPDTTATLNSFSDKRSDALGSVRAATTPAELRSGVKDATLEWQEQMITLQTQRLNQADTHATQQGTEQARSRRLTFWGSVGSWVAAVASVAALIVMLVPK